MSFSSISIFMILKESLKERATYVRFCHIPIYRVLYNSANVLMNFTCILATRLAWSPPTFSQRKILAGKKMKVEQAWQATKREASLLTSETSKVRFVFVTDYCNAESMGSSNTLPLHTRNPRYLLVLSLSYYPPLGPVLSQEEKS